MDDVAPTTNKVAVIYSAYQLRDCISPSSLDEIRTQDPYQSIDFLQPSFYQVLPVSASHDLSSICFLTDAITRQVSCVLLSIYRLTIFGYFSAALLFTN